MSYMHTPALRKTFGSPRGSGLNESVRRFLDRGAKSLENRQAALASQREFFPASRARPPKPPKKYFRHPIGICKTHYLKTQERNTDEQPA
jgi:hypothetical protein